MRLNSLDFEKNLPKAAKLFFLFLEHDWHLFFQIPFGNVWRVLSIIFL